jgi:hypothetical protein
MEDLQPFRNKKNLIQPIDFQYIQYCNLILISILLSSTSAVSVSIMNLYLDLPLYQHQSQIRL